jgi:hypothetical protein
MKTTGTGLSKHTVHAMTLIIDLPEEKEAALRAHAEAAGLSAEDFARQTLAQALASPLPADERRVVDERPLSEVIREIVGEIPAEELAKLPKDGSSQIDHYVYGLPKRD